MDSVSDLRSKEIKRATLNELVEYVSTNRGVIIESAYSDIVKMVSKASEVLIFLWIHLKVQPNTTCSAVCCVLNYLSVVEQGSG